MNTYSECLQSLALDAGIDYRQEYINEQQAEQDALQAEIEALSINFNEDFTYETV